MRRSLVLLVSFFCGLLIVFLYFRGVSLQQTHICESPHSTRNFLVVGGGYEPHSNEIALEKNVRYFQGTLKFMKYDPKQVASIFFANGNNREASVRYLDKQRIEKFKRPDIPDIQGATSLDNLECYFRQLAQQKSSKVSFLYFTGHGRINEQDLENNDFMLWNEQRLSVRQFSEMLDKMPTKTCVVTMMAQCFSGSFANFIYKNGNPEYPVALQTRCGFFATIKSRPSVGCTPEVNEADYRDYSSSFFAGLSGRNRANEPVTSADYNHDGQISFAEAHAFAKVDEKSTDLPISTSESWLQNKVSPAEKELLINQFTSQTISQILNKAHPRPEQLHVINSLMEKINKEDLDKHKLKLTLVDIENGEINQEQTYLARLIWEIINIDAERKIRSYGNQKDIGILNKLLKCESGSWKKSIS